MKSWRPLALTAALLPLTVVGAQADQFVRMVSGPSGGSWYPLGAKIMQVMDDEIDGITTSNTSGGGISNILSVMPCSFRMASANAVPVHFALPGEIFAPFMSSNDVILLSLRTAT